MSKQLDFGPLAQLVKRHGFFTTRRALVGLAAAAVFVSETGNEPTIEALSAFWGQHERTTYRETSAWRKVSGGADLGDAARRVVSTYRAEVVTRENVDALALDLARMVPTV